jgi:MFS family permease
VPRRLFLVVSNLLSALGMLPLLLVHDTSDVWIIYVVAFVYGISFVVEPAALNGLLKEMLPEQVLVDANASLSVTREAFRLVGPLAGAGLFAVFHGGAVVAVLDAATFVVSAICVASLSVVEVRERHEPMHWRAEVLAGLTHIRRTPVLLHSTLALALCLLVLGFTESAVYAVVEAFHKPVTFVGPVATVQGAGAIVGGLLSGRVVKRFGEPRAIAAGLAALVLGILGVAAATAIPALLVAVAVLGLGIPVLIVAYNTLLQKLTPGRLMGRVSTATDVLTSTPQAVSIATGALLVTLLDYRLIFVLIATGTLAALVYLVTVLRGRLGPVAAVGGATADPVPDAPVDGQAVAPLDVPQPELG